MRPVVDIIEQITEGGKVPPRLCTHDDVPRRVPVPVRERERRAHVARADDHLEEPKTRSN